MSANENAKLKLLYIMKILLKQSDESHFLTVSDIIRELSVYGITAERKSIYTDICLLEKFGLDIECVRKKANNYFVGDRDFQITELILLIDAVQSSKFITRRKSDELINKIVSLVSLHEAKELKKHLTRSNLLKTTNESVYYNVDSIYRAIKFRKKVKFKYFDYTINKDIKYRGNGNYYIVSPYILDWYEDKYYMLAYHDKYNKIVPFRVDRMTKVNVSDENRPINIEYDNYDFESSINKSFNMFYSSEVKKVEIEFSKKLVNNVIDKFGREVILYNKTEKTFCVSVDVDVSDAFLGWIFKFGNQVKIIHPESVIEKLKKHVSNILSMYEGN